MNRPEEAKAEPVTGGDASDCRAASSLREDVLVRWFLRGVAMALVLTSVAKLVSLAGGEAILAARDPVFGVPYRWALPAESVIELSVAVFLFARIPCRFRLLLVAWLGASFCAYHVGLWLLEPAALCSCLGTLYGRFEVGQRHLDLAARILALCFLSGPVIFWGRWSIVRGRRLP